MKPLLIFERALNMLFVSGEAGFNYLDKAVNRLFKGPDVGLPAGRGIFKHQQKHLGGFPVFYGQIAV